MPTAPPDDPSAISITGPDSVLAPDRVSAEQARLAAWSTRLGAMCAEEAALREAGCWFSGASDLLGVLGLSRRELVHCALLAWALDPASPHGLGTALLERLLALCFGEDRPHAADLVRSSARCEVARALSRADIVVTGATFTLVVEAKVDALERDRQCDDLYEDFAEDPGALFIFLTPDGRAPVSATGRAADAFRSLSFRRVREELQELVAEREAGIRKAGGWHTMASWLRTLQVEFP